MDHWNDNRRDRNTEVKILKEIANGLQKDVEDIKLNVYGHNIGIRACQYWRVLIVDEQVNQDSLAAYFTTLTRSFISIQNRSGYESLKSKGLELIQDDSLRFAIISLYEYDFNILQKLEEEYSEMQFHENYADDFNRILAPHFMFDVQGKLIGIEKLSKNDRQLVLAQLWNIQYNREFVLNYYWAMEKKITALDVRIKRKLQE